MRLVQIGNYRVDVGTVIQPSLQFVAIGGPRRAELPEGPALGLGKVLGGQPAGRVILDVVEVNGSKSPIDTDPRQKRDPTIMLIRLKCLICVFLQPNLVVLVIC